MKVPKYIKEAIRKTAYHSSVAHNNDAIVRDWLEKNKIIDSDSNDLTFGEFSIDGYIDSCNYGLTTGDDVIEELEALEMKIGDYKNGM